MDADEDEGDNKVQELLKRRLEQYQKAQENERKLKMLLSQILEPAAYERMMNVRIANPELYASTANAAVYYYQRIKRKITEQELITLLSAQTEKREGKIDIRRK